MNDYSVADYNTRWAEVKASSAALVGPSLADRLAAIEAEEPGFTGRMLDDLGPLRSTMLAFDWRFWARPKQLAPLTQIDWGIMLYEGGRGSGKTRVAAEWIVDRLEHGARDIAIVGPTEGDVKEFMIGGWKRRVDAGNGSGLLDVLPPWIRFEGPTDQGEIIFPDHRAIARLHSGAVAEYRGPAPDTVWGDEPIKWRYPERLISNLRLACREVGRLPAQMLFTTSPKRGLRFLHDLVMEDGVRTIHSSLHENRGHVDEAYYQRETRRLAGTRQGAEEIEGELTLDDGSGLFGLSKIDAHRVDEAPQLERIVVAVDPSGSQFRTSDATGIVAAGRAGDVHTGHGYVIADRTEKYSWEGWGIAAFKLAEELGASAIVIERNKFADAVAANIRSAAAARGYEAQPRPGFRHLIDLVHAKTGRRIQLIEVLSLGDKATRAQTAATLYEGGRVHHVGRLASLEDAITSWDPTSSVSPNEMDALAHAMTELFALDRAPETSGSSTMRGIAEANKMLAARAPIWTQSRGGQGLSRSPDRGGRGSGNGRGGGRSI